METKKLRLKKISDISEIQRYEDLSDVEQIMMKGGGEGYGFLTTIVKAIGSAVGSVISAIGSTDNSEDNRKDESTNNGNKSGDQSGIININQNNYGPQPAPNYGTGSSTSTIYNPDSIREYPDGSRTIYGPDSIVDKRYY